VRMKHLTVGVLRCGLEVFGDKNTEITRCYACGSDLSDTVCCRCEYLTLRRAGMSADGCLLLGHDPQARRIPAAFTDFNIQSTGKAVSKIRAGGTCLTRRTFDPHSDEVMALTKGIKTSLSSVRRVSKHVIYCSKRGQARAATPKVRPDDTW
jgi:hypothetical protein